MNEKNVVICDGEIRYANSLSENIRKRSEFSVRVYVCSSLEHVIQLMNDRPIHIFITDETYRYEERKQIVAGQTFILAAGQVADRGEDERVIGKYQCSDEIIRQIFEWYMEFTRESLVKTTQKGQTQIIGVYSPIHRIGKTTFALALGRECAKKKKTLYLNLEEYAGFEGSMEEGVNLGDLLYYLRQAEGAFEVRLQSAVKKSGDLDYILPIPVNLDFREVTWSEWRCLLECIVKDSAYECVILDLGESTQGLFSILELCNRVYMPILNDPISRRKVQRYEELVERLRLESLKRCTHRFVMPDQIEEYAKIRAKEEC